MVNPWSIAAGLALAAQVALVATVMLRAGLARRRQLARQKAILGHGMGDCWHCNAGYPAIKLDSLGRPWCGGC